MTTPLPELRWYAIGPHGFYDLVRLARRGRSSLVRIGYMAALFAALAIVYHNEAGLFWPRMIATTGPPVHERSQSINTNARIAERFSITILVMQNLAVLVLMPIYVAASIHEERDKRTLPILFTTHLSAREIVQGKWLARVGHVGSILLGGLPVLSFAQLWGGIDMPMIAANFCNTGLWLISTAGFSAMTATQSRTLVRSLVKTYLLMLGVGLIFTCCCMPWDFRGDLVFLLRPVGDAEHSYFRMWFLVGILAGIHVGLTAFFLRRAAHTLDLQRRQDIAPEWIDTEFAPLAAEVRLAQRPVRDHALIWKECNVEPPIFNFVPKLMSLVLLCFVFGYLTTSLPLSVPPEHQVGRSDFQGIFAFYLFASFGSYASLVVIRLTGSIVREREQQTLESLLTLPVGRFEMLWDRLCGILLRYWPWLIPAAIAWVMMTAEYLHAPFPALILLLAMATHLAFLAMFGLFLSVYCRTTIAAYVSLGVVVLVYFIGTLFGPVFLDPQYGDVLLYGLNPVGCWLAISRAQWDNDAAIPTNSVFGLLVYALAALVMAFLTLRQFERRVG